MQREQAERTRLRIFRQKDQAEARQVYMTEYAHSSSCWRG